MTAEPMMKQLRPFWGRVLVMESGVDEEQRASGLIVPVKDDSWLRGVIVEIDEEFNAASPYIANQAAGAVLAKGLVIYFLSGPGSDGRAGAVKIGDLYVVDPARILAYEEER